MVLTRSNSGRPAATQSTEPAPAPTIPDNGESGGTPSHTTGSGTQTGATTTTSGGPSTHTWTSGTEPTATSTAATTETEAQSHGQFGRPRTVISRRSNRSTLSQSLRLAKAREEMLQIKLDLAQAKIATMEAEAEAEEEQDSDDDARTELSHHTASQQRVGEWVQASQQQLLAIEANPAPAAPIAPEVERQQAPPPCLPPVMVNNPTAQQQPPVVQAPQPPAGEGAIVPHQQSPISELATAIIQASRLAAPTNRFTSELPTYSGAHQEWLVFKSAYQQTAATFSNLENLSRLRRSLKGRAREAVESLLITTSQPEDIMKMLESRFGRPDSIALAEMERLRALPRLTDNPKEVCIFASKVANIVATLKALGRQHYLYNPEITKMTVEKLTAALRYRWYDYSANKPIEEPDLVTLSRFLNREADVCSPYAQPENILTEAASGSGRKIPQRVFGATAAAEQEKKCPICRKHEHRPLDCPVFKEADSNGRWELAKQTDLCYRCLKRRIKKHRCPPKECNTNGCKRRHHPALHFTAEEKPEVVSNTWVPNSDNKTFLKIIPVEVKGPKGSVFTFALLDDGSTVTLVEEQLAKWTGVDGPEDPLQIEAIGDSRISCEKSKRVEITLRGTNGGHRIRARTISKLNMSPQSIEEDDLRNCPHLIDIAKEVLYQHGRPRILIGQDNWHLLLSEECRRGRSDQPVATKTALGWVLHGAKHKSSAIQRVNFTTTRPTIEDSMDEQLRQHLAVDSLLIEAKRPTTDPEQQALTILEKNTTVREDGFYQTAMLWKKEEDRLPYNHEMAKSRLLSLEKKLDKDPQGLKTRYEHRMEEMLAKGYAEAAPIEKTEGRTFYSPHFAVVNPLKPEKVRIVLDAAARTAGKSLNDFLLTGPDLLQSLPGVLMRYRQHKIAVTADIADMFLRIKIRTEDRDALRFLWRGSNRGAAEIREYRMTSLIFGATSSPATAIYVKNLNAEKHRQRHPEAAKAITHNHYMDDYLQSFHTEDEAVRITKEVSTIHQQAQFKLTKWTSNSPKVLQDIEPIACPGKVELQKERTLRLIWDPATDTLGFNLELARLPDCILSTARPTKRQVLKAVMSLYDPLGLVAPITSKAKQLIQELWRRGTGWDEQIPEDLATQWVDWTGHLQHLKTVTIDRCYPGYTEAANLQLHVFTDASESAYAAAVYWRATAPDGSVRVSLAAARARVAPLKHTSVPRLELQAAVLGSRIATTVIEEHDRKPDTRYYWTDSRTILAWLRNGARAYRPYVAHRVAAIEEGTQLSEWRWIPTRMNVADDATREIPTDFGSGHRWFRGPEFLLEDEAHWPKESTDAVTDNTGEEKVHTTRVVAKIENVIPDPHRFSKWERLLRSTARVLQFISLCRRRTEMTNSYRRTKKNTEDDETWGKTSKNKSPAKVTPQKLEQKRFRNLSGEELQRAANLIVKATQQQAFQTEIQDLQKGRPIASSSRLHRLAVELTSDGLIQLRSRIAATQSITASQRSPLVIDGNHYAARLYIDHVHRQLHHAGVEATTNDVRQHYWILRLRPTVRAVVHQCPRCRIKKTMPPRPATGNHPHTRLAHHQRPFTFTGLDYFGPVNVSVGRSTQKCYVALFTCLTTRAVHLEVAGDLSASACVMALRRMMARRGCPTEIWSDNGTNLRGADKLQREAINHDVAEEASKRAINWRFIPPGAPFMGGAWERMVRSVKTAMAAVLNERCPKPDILATLLAEAEFTINSRPLTHVTVDPDDDEALTPNHFLLGGPARLPTPGTFDDSDLIGRAHWRTAQRLADMFWARWLREYLPELQHRREPYSQGATPRIGDVVLVVDSTLPRNTWPRGIIEAVYPGLDGIARVVDVKTKGGVFRRPTKRIVILPTKGRSSAPP